MFSSRTADSLPGWTVKVEQENHTALVRKRVKVQHNPTNGVLALFRKQRGPWAPLHAHIDGFLNGIRRLASEGFSIAEIEHADRVLRRLRVAVRRAAIEELLALDYDTTDKEN